MEEKQNKKVNIEKLKSSVKEALAKLDYQATVGDIAVDTGYSTLYLELVLKELLRDYLGHLKVSENGDLVYYFPSKFAKSRGNAFTEFLKEFLIVIGKVFRFLYKISIMVVLVLYFIIFLVILLIILFGFKSAKDKGGGSRRGGSSFKGFDFVFFLFFRDRYDKFEKSETPYLGKRRFYKSIFAYVFGEGNPNLDMFKKMNRIIANFIKRKKGAIISQEIVPLKANDIKNAETEITEQLVNFEGEPVVSDNGTIIYHFPKLMTTADDDSLYEDRRYFPKARNVNDEDILFEQEWKFADNTSGANTVITLFNLFNLIMSGLFFWGGADFSNSLFNLISNTTSLSTVTISNFGYIFLGIFPFFFSILFFLIPLIRIIINKIMNAKIRKRNIYRAVCYKIFRSDFKIKPDELQINQTFGLECSFEEEKEILDKMAAQFICEIKYTDSGSFYYDFGELQTAFDDLHDFRAKINPEDYRIKKDDITYSTYDE